MVEARENAIAVNAQRANDLRESAEIVAGAKIAPSVQAEVRVQGTMELPGTTVSATGGDSASAFVAMESTPPSPAPGSAEPIGISGLHVRFAIAAGLMVLLFILWVRQRHVRT